MPKVHAGGDFLCPAYMLGKIALEEAIHMPETVDFCKNQAILGRGDAFAEQMLDIHGERLEIMTESNVELFVLSLASPRPQGRSVKDDAEGLAQRANDYMAKEVAKNPRRFAGFASLSMHDPHQAAAELRRAITELGLKGAILNDYQSGRQSQHGNDSHPPRIEDMLIKILAKSQGRNNAIKLLKLDLPLLGVEAVMDGLTRQV